MNPFLESPLVATILTLLIGLLAAVVKIALLIGEIRLKVDTLWAFQIRRGFAEALQKGLIRAEDPE